MKTNDIILLMKTILSLNINELICLKGINNKIVILKRKDNKGIYYSIEDNKHITYSDSCIMTLLLTNKNMFTENTYKATIFNYKG